MDKNKILIADAISYLGKFITKELANKGNDHIHKIFNNFAYDSLIR